MTDIEKITLKIQEIQAQHELLRRQFDELKAQKPQKVEKISVDVDYIVKQSVIECEKIIKLNNDEQQKSNKTQAEHTKSTNEDLKKLNLKVSFLSNGIDKAINSAIDKKVNVNFVNNLYRNK